MDPNKKDKDMLGRRETKILRKFFDWSSKTENGEFKRNDKLYELYKHPNRMGHTERMSQERTTRILKGKPKESEELEDPANKR